MNFPYNVPNTEAQWDRGKIKKGALMQHPFFDLRGDLTVPGSPDETD